MIKNFRQVHPNLYRGGKLTPRDVLILYRKFGVRTIISLDQQCADLISPMCQALHIKHIVIPIDSGDIRTLQYLLRLDLKSLIDPNVPTYIHCLHGRDRTGMFVALVRCLIDHWDCHRALSEAKRLRFGVGLDLSVEKFYVKLISRACTHSHQDVNHSYDLMSNLLDYNAQYRDYNIDKVDRQSWAPYADVSVRTFPYSVIEMHHPWEGEGPTRETYDLKGIDIEREPVEYPAVGIFDQTSQITNMIGPSVISGGFV